MSATPLLEISDIHTYYDASHVLHGVNLTIGHGESVSLMGRNGMGKTTTIRSIFGLTPPRHGRIMFDGMDMTKVAPHVIARSGLGLVPEGRGIFPTLTVKENLIMSARPAGEKGMADAIDWTLERVIELFPRLGERLNNMGNQLSGGEQQMLAIGRALMTNPRLLILDEATEGLAPLIRQEIWSVIRRIKNSGIATLIVDKDVTQLLKVCDRCVILAKGHVVYSGTSENLAANPDIHKKHLGI